MSPQLGERTSWETGYQNREQRARYTGPSTPPPSYCDPFDPRVSLLSWVNDSSLLPFAKAHSPPLPNEGRTPSSQLFLTLPNISVDASVVPESQPQQNALGSKPGGRCCATTPTALLDHTSLQAAGQRFTWAEQNLGGTDLHRSCHSAMMGELPASEDYGKATFLSAPTDLIEKTDKCARPIVISAPAAIRPASLVELSLPRDGRDWSTSSAQRSSRPESLKSRQLSETASPEHSGRPSRSITAIVNEIDRQNGGAPSLVCLECGYKPTGFEKNHKAHLKRHSLIHSGAQYNCDQCPRRYSRKDNLGQHKLRAHRGGDDIVVPKKRLVKELT